MPRRRWKTPRRSASHPRCIGRAKRSSRAGRAVGPTMLTSGGIAKLFAVGENRPDENPAFTQWHRDGRVGTVHIHATLGIHRDGSRFRIYDPELRGSEAGQGGHGLIV